MTDMLNKAKALFDAAYRGEAGAVDALLIAGAPLDARDRRGNTPLMVAAANGHDEVVASPRSWRRRSADTPMPHASCSSTTRR
jgi:ankyrin repeat protein